MPLLPPSSRPARFLSTLSLRRATFPGSDLVRDSQFLSTLSLRRATGKSSATEMAGPISIHALLAESDGIGLVFLWWGVRFLSTLSLRRATSVRPDIRQHDAISIHALLAESDGIGLVFLWWGVRFLSTLSLRRATSVRPDIRQHDAISIHALLAESDGCDILSIERCSLFLSTLSLRRATVRPTGRPAYHTDFYPRSPCGERPLNIFSKLKIIYNFYPRSPCGERRQYTHVSRILPRISIHALLAESDSRIFLHRATNYISIHALLAESDIRNAEAVSKYMIFLSTLSLRRATSQCRTLASGM